VSKAREEPSSDEDSSNSRLPVWLQQLTVSAAAIRELAQAQWSLLGAELRLARSAVRTALVSMVMALVFLLGFGLVLLGLIAVALVYWLGSWIVALGILAAILLVCLGISLLLFRRCVIWMTLPETRAQLRALTHDLHEPATARGKEKDNEPASSRE
jgi:hypothetical protein